MSATALGAQARVDLWNRLFHVCGAEPRDLEEAMRASQFHNLVFGDAMVWAVMRRASVPILLSEDFQNGRELEGVRFINPFDPANAAMIEEMLVSA